MPDVSLVPELCQILHININEFLAGEKLEPNELSKKAEDNTLNLLRENRESQKKNIFSIMIGIGLLIAGIFVTFCFGEFNILWYIDMATFWSCTCICVAILLIAGKKTKKENIHLLKGIIIPVGSVVSLITVIYVMGSLSDMSVLGPKLAIAILAVLYSIIAYIILAVIEQKIE